MADNSFSNPEMGVAVNSVRASGGGALTGFTLPKLLWVRDNEPRNFERVRKSA
jgi:xylulokinase